MLKYYWLVVYFFLSTVSLYARTAFLAPSPVVLYCKVCNAEPSPFSHYDSLCHQLHCSVMEEEALVSYNQALLFLEEAYHVSLPKEYLLFGHYLMSNICNEQQLYTESLFHIKKAYALATQLNKPLLQANLHLNWGNNHAEFEKYDLALAHYLIAQRMGLGKEFADSIRLFNAISLCYSRMGQEKRAVKYGQKAVKYAESIGDTALLTLTYCNYALICMESFSVFEETLPYLNKAEKCASVLKAGSFLMTNYYNKYLVHEYRKEDKEALDCLYQYNLLRDSLYGQDRVWQLAKKKEELEVQKRELEIAKQKAENERSRARTQLVFGIAIFLAILFVGAYLAMHRIRNQKLELERLNDFKNRLFGIIGHDLKGAIAQLLLAQTQWAAYYEQNAKHPQLSQLLLKVQRIANTQKNILDNVFSWGKLLLNSQYYEKEIVSLKEILEEEKENVAVMAEEKGIRIEMKIPQYAKIVADRNALKVVFRNLFANAIKFSHPQSSITLWVEEDETDTFYDIYLKDTGIGIAAEKIPMLFEVSKEKQQNGTSSEKGTGLGLYICKRFVEGQAGKLSLYQTEIGKGTTFWIQFLIEE